MDSPLARTVAYAQAVYYLLTGIWPVLHMPSFELLTGRKKDDWLVKTVGLLLAVIGAVVGLGARRQRTAPEHALLGAGSAMSLIGIDVVYYSRGILRFVYLMDAAAQALLAAGWITAWLQARQAKA